MHIVTGWRPLLRSPPFPGVDPRVAEVCRPGAPTPYVEGQGLAAGALVAAAKVGGCFWGRSAEPVSGVLRADRFPADADPWPAIAAADQIVGGESDELVLLGLAAGRPVHRVSGEPFTAAEADRLLHAALLSGSDHRDPWTSRPADLHRVVEVLALWRRMIDENRVLAAAAGMAWWKRSALDTFLWRGGAGATPRQSPRRVLATARRVGGSVAAWPSRVPAGFQEQAASAGVSVVEVEDGFIRSAGLGSDLLPPLSVIVDPVGIYYDPHRPSGLETLLATADFSPALLDRAASLRARIIAEHVGKYERGGAGQSFPLPAGRRIVLVAGQVEDDRSVMLGGGGVAGNADLLARARQEEPGAFIAYRPHPDVEAGHRRGHMSDAQALRHADVVLRGGALPVLLSQVDAVHVLSSLTGFEALLRGREVFVHGQPFYAGWGLTYDRGPAIVRRSRRLELDQLVAAALILYPRYLDPVTGLPCPPETLLDRLQAGLSHRLSMLTRLRRAQGRLRRAWVRRRHRAL